MYWSTFIGKSKERKIFDFLHCPFEPPAKQHRPVCQLGWILWSMLARPSKGQCRNSKFFPPQLLAVKEDQNIFFLETCFASTISKPEFTVCLVLVRFSIRPSMQICALHFGTKDEPPYVNLNTNQFLEFYHLTKDVGHIWCQFGKHLPCLDRKESLLVHDISHISKDNHTCHLLPNLVLHLNNMAQLLS